MSPVSTTMKVGQRLAASAVMSVTDPDATAPAELQTKTNTMWGIVKWGSLKAVLGLFLAAGMISLAGDRGYGGGMSPERKPSITKGVIALVIAGSEAQIVTYRLGLTGAVFQPPASIQSP